jgi:sugar (pentulose or hexulose) kinase
MLAAVGLGWFAGVEDACRELVQLGEVMDPTGDASAYDDAYARYRALYPALAPTFHATP